MEKNARKNTADQQKKEIKMRLRERERKKRSIAIAREREKVRERELVEVEGRLDCRSRMGWRSPASRLDWIKVRVILPIPSLARMARKVTTDAKPPSLEKKGLLKEALKGDGAKFYRSWLAHFQRAEGDGANFYNSWLAFVRKTKDWLEDDTIIKRHAALITVAAGWFGAIACLLDFLRRHSQELKKRNDMLELVDSATASSKLFSILAVSQLSLANAKLSTLVGTAKLILNAIVVFAFLVSIYITYKICSN